MIQYLMIPHKLLLMIRKNLLLLLGIFVGTNNIPQNTYAIPIIGPCSTPLARQTFKITSHFLYMDFHDKWIPIDTAWAPLGKDSSYRAVLSLWELYYGFENIFTLRAAAQLHYQNKHLGEGKIIYGVGDIVIDAKYNIWGPAHRELTYAGKLYPEFSAIGGMRLPMGSSKDTPAPVVRWLGGRSTDVEICGLFRVGNGIGAVYGTIGYWYNGVSGDDRDDEVFYNFTVEGPQIFEKNYLILLVELDGSKIGRYYHLTQICPGAQFIITYGRGIKAAWRVEQAVVIEASVLIPIEAEGEYKYRVTPFIGMTWTF